MTSDLAAHELVEIVPLLRRMAELDPKIVVRVRRRAGQISAIVRTPFDVLAARSVASESAGEPLDVTLSAVEAIAWIDGDIPEQPTARDAEWRWPVPPESGWQRIDQVPDTVIRQLVRAGALTLKEAAVREGVPGATPRAEVSDALLDSIVLTVTADETPATAEVTLRVLSALTRLGFLARDSHAAVDRAGRWVRVVGSYGTVYREAAPLGLSVVR